jgi:Cof subfamily protein (haloacid dehalogenase superfamily)
MIRLIAIDIDGTLLDSHGRLPAANAEAIGEALAAGIEVALVTGRGLHFARPVADLLPSPLTLIVSNGALVKRRDGQTLLSRLLPAAVARDVLAAAAAYRDATAVVFDRTGPGQVVSGGMDWLHPTRRGYYQLHQEVIAEVHPLEASLTEDPVQVMFNGTVAAMRELAGALNARPGAERYTVVMTEYERRDFTLLDVLGAGIDKGTTVAEWAGRRGYRPSEVMAVGDNHNDRSMLAYAGFPVVMGNAVAELKALGLPATATNDQAGLAQAIRRFALPAGRPGVA